MLKIIPLDSTDATALSVLAKDIYKEHYLHLWHPGGAEWYMNEHAYHPETLRAELADSNNLHYIVYHNGYASGYLKIRINAVLKGQETYNGMEIERIYLHSAETGRGTGQRLMLFSEELAASHKKNRLFLKAMDSSTAAIRFYKKMGYTPCGTYTLPFPLMKEAYRGMVILKKELC